MTEKKEKEVYQELATFFGLVIGSEDICFPTYEDIQCYYNNEVAKNIMNDINEFKNSNSENFSRLKNLYSNKKYSSFADLRRESKKQTYNYQLMLDDMAELAIAIYFSSPKTLERLDLLRSLGTACYNDKIDEEIKWIHQKLKVNKKSQS